MKIWERLFRSNKTEPVAKEEERFILCIDGGGMRGIIPVVFLQILAEHLDLDISNGIKCSDIAKKFDLISGTSTGGLIALALTCQDKLTLSDLEDIYMYRGSDIFIPHATDILGLRHIITDSKYHSYGIENLLEEWFGNTLLAEAITPTVIMSYDLAKGKETILSSYEGAIFAKDAGRATSAAPTFFTPLELHSQILVDGGVIANNPSIYAFYEAKKLYPNCKKFHILSLGTAGISHTMEMSDTGGLLSWIEQVVPMYTTAQKQTCDYVMNHCPEIQYTRIDADLAEEIKMDDVRTQSMIIARNTALLSADKSERKFKEYAEKIKAHINDTDLK